MVDGSEILHQCRLVFYPIIYRVLYIPGGCLGFLLSIVNSITPLIGNPYKVKFMILPYYIEIMGVDRHDRTYICGPFLLLMVRKSRTTTGDV